MNETWKLFYNDKTGFFQKNKLKDNDLFADPIDLNDNNIPNGNSIYLYICNKLCSWNYLYIFMVDNSIIDKILITSIYYFTLNLVIFDLLYTIRFWYYYITIFNKYNYNS